MHEYMSAGVLSQLFSLPESHEVQGQGQETVCSRTTKAQRLLLTRKEGAFLRFYIPTPTRVDS